VRTFRDREGREWQIDLTLGALMRIKASTGLDMLDLQAPKEGRVDVFDRLSTDPVTLADTLCAICRPQLDARSLTDSQFADAMGGEAIDSALIALVQEWSDFFHRRGAEAKAKLLAMAVKVMQGLNDRMNAATATLDEGKAVESILGSMSTNSRGSSASTPAGSPSES
jgi:hypothetical protein